jgi:sodium-dependent dicarboxylate transporter 2/3/5
MNLSSKIGLFVGPILFFILINLPEVLITENADAVVAVALWMIIWWVTEAVSISVTALLPLLLFPILKIMPIGDVGANYGSPIVFLFFGGFVMALALEKVNLHKRIALNIIRLTGTTADRVVLGFMIATAVLSMWISNTASTVVMLPIAMSVINLLIEDADGFTKRDRNFALSVMLGIAFAANAENEYQIEISFLKWMVIGLPFSLIMITICYFVLVKLFFPTQNLKFKASKTIIYQELDKLGPTSGKEKMVLAIFGVTVFLWVFRTLINSIFPDLELSDTLISIFAAIALFTLPYNLKKGDFILQWQDTQKLAWGILILFGGGLSLANGMSVSGIVDLVADSIAQSNLSILFTASLLIILMLFMTELMSNVALVAVLAPVVAGIAIGLGVPIIYLLIPVTIASSCAFMLPMATPPNAIVFASGYIKVHEMARAGLILNLISVLLLIGMFQFILPLIF